MLRIDMSMKLDKELVAASSAPLVLSVLAEGDSYGYAIIQRVRELSDGKIEWTDGMLYPVLHWLEENGQIRGRWEKAESGRRRRYYSLGSKGKTALQEHREQWETVNTALRQLWRKQYA
jgi:PadR family transcriptional regulator, regulatory protein PadR